MQAAQHAQEALRFIAAPPSGSKGKTVDEAVEDERAWVDALTRTPSAKILVQHFAAFESILRSGGQKGVEPSADQVSTWRRMFCWQLRQSDSPFGINCADGKLPKCIAMCNLSGQHAFYYCETFSLARILCLVPQESHARVIVGVSKVIAKAIELDASVWAGFCLPFQVGFDRCYWEVRTVRKTRSGRVKDGEMAFACHDTEPRVMGCTETEEHWPDEMFKELCKKLLTMVSPVCIDPVEDGGDVQMTPQKMELAIKILKEDRKRTQDHHKQTVDGIREMYRVAVSDLEAKIAAAEENANVRVSGVLKAAQTAKSTAEEKNKELESHVATLSKQVATLRNMADDAKSRMAGMMLRHEEESNASAARQKTLEAQIASMSSSHARQCAESTKRVKETARKHEEQMSVLKRSLSDVQKKSAGLSSAASAMNASVKEAHGELASMKQRNALLRFALKLGACRFEDIAQKLGALESKEQAVSSELDGLKARVKQMSTQAEEEASRAARAEPPPVKLEVSVQTASVDTNKKIEEAERATHEAKRETAIQVGKKEQVIADLGKRCKSLEARISEMETESKRAMVAAPPPPPPAPPQTRKRGAREDHPPTMPHLSHQNTVNVSQNNVYMHPPHHQQAFPQGPYTVDPALEGMISQLHNALNCITAMARSSGSASRAAEVAQAKLDALSGVGYHSDPHQQHCYYGNGY